jgi:signal transduction histidine kinase
MQSISLRIVIGILWLALSVSLGTWWAIIGVRQSESIAELQRATGMNTDLEALEYIEKQHRMIRYEGVFFLLLITGGGLSLILMSVRDVRRNKMIKDFFATVTHEMKTPLASLRLQAESLKELLISPKHKVLVKRLISDSGRLELQMDKALYLASISRSESLFTESILIGDVISHVSGYFENVEYHIDKNLTVRGDRRALESIFRNLIENAFHHGEASSVDLMITKKNGMVAVEVSDNGSGFKGDLKKIGRLFHRHSTSSGSGVGLFLVKTLVNKMQGTVSFENTNPGFKVSILLLEGVPEINYSTLIRTPSL